MLKFIYKLYKRQIQDLVVDDVIGIAPDSIREPVFKLLQEQKETFNRWLVWSSWHLQKKIVSENEKGVIKGCLLHIRCLMIIASKQENVLYSPIREERTKDPMMGVHEFIKKNKENS